MDVKEFRIGNKVMDKVTKKVGEVMLLKKSGAYGVVIINEEVEDPEWVPIPITEEWLVRFGITSERRRYHIEGGIYIVFYDTNPTLCNYDSDYGMLLLPFELKHVHQLQNLYFALTGKELEVK